MTEPQRVNRLVEQVKRAQCSWEAFELTNQVVSLQAALTDWVEVLANPLLDELPEPYQAAVFNNAGMAFYANYQLAGQKPHLDQAIRLYEQAQKLTQDTHHRQASVLSNLSVALQARSVCANALTDLDKAIEVIRAAIRLIPADAPERAGYLSNLSGALHERFLRTQHFAELESGIQASEEARALTPDGAPTLPLRLNNLATLWHERYNRSGALEDLQRAIQFYREVLAACDETTPNRNVYLNNLGGALNDLYRRSGELTDVQAAIEALREAVRLTPSAALNRAGFLNNLGNALSEYFLRTHQLAAQEEAIAVQRDAVALAPAAHLPAFLTSLGTSLNHSFEFTGESTFAMEASSLCEQALALTLPGTPKYASRVNNLARSFRNRYQSSGLAEDLERGQQLYLQACKQGLSLQPELALLAGYNWGVWALERSAWEEAVRALTMGLEAAQDLFMRQVLRRHRESWLREAQALPGLAAYALARTGCLEDAIVLLENWRARLLGEVLDRAQPDMVSKDSLEITLAVEHYHQSVQQLEELESKEWQAGFSSSIGLADKLRRERQTVRDNAIAILGKEAIVAPIKLSRLRKILCPTPQQAGLYWVVTPVGGMVLALFGERLQAIWLKCSEDDLDRWLWGSSENKWNGYLAGILSYGPLRPALDALWSEWNAQLLAPVAGAIKAIWPPTQKPRQLFFITMGRLALLPLHIADYGATVTYTPSASVLAHCKRRARRSLPRQFLGVGNPMPVSAELPDLPYARTEVEGVAQFFSPLTKTWCEVIVTLEQIQAALPTSSYVHLACHAAFNISNPIGSGLWLGTDQTLTLQDLFTQRLLRNNRLVVLSACQTAIIDFNRLPEEVIGLHSGFLQAGAAGVVGALWPVNDLSTALFMQKFYSLHIKEGLLPAEALGRAQSWLRQATNEELAEWKAYPFALALDSQAKPFAHPYYWAPFVFYGA